MPDNRSIEEINEELAKAQEKLTEEHNSFTGTTEETKERVDQLTKELDAAKKAEIARTKELDAALRDLKQTTVDYFGAMTEGEQGAGQMNNALKSSGNLVSLLLSNFGILGKVLGKLVEGAVSVATKVNDQSDKLYETFQQFGKFGATSKDGMSDIFKNLQKFGYGIDQLKDMTQLLSQNASTLAKLGGSVSVGVNKLADISDDILHSEVGAGLMRMGKTVGDINKYSADYMRQQILMGGDRKDQLHFLAQNTAEFAYQMDALARLTGNTREQQQRAMEEALGDEAFNQQMAEWNKMAAGGDQDAQKQIDKWREIMASSLPEATKQELARSMAGDYGAAQKAVLSMPDAVRLARDKNATAADIINKARDQLKYTQTAMGGLAKYHAYNDTYGDIKEQRGFLAQMGDEAYEDLIERAKKQQVVTDKATNDQTQIRISQMNTRDAFQAMVNEGVLPLTDALSSLAQAPAWLAKVPSAYVPSFKPAGVQGIGEGPTGGPQKPVSGTVDQILATIRQRESGGNYQASAKGSTASGAYQFIDSTWQSLAKQYGVGTQYQRAKDAPKDVQDALAGRYVEGILKKANGDVSKVPLAWYTGNIEGKMSAKALAANNGLTPEQYQRKWLEAFNKNAGPGVATEANQGAGVSVRVDGPQGTATRVSGKPELTTISTPGGRSAQVNVAAAPAFQKLVNWLETTAGYKITSIGGYVDRDVRGRPGVKSAHAMGAAIDINPEQNPLSSQLITNMPKNIGQVANSLGLGWGGDWHSRKDAMHFSAATNEGGSFLKFATGGIASGPHSGYEVTLHGTEAIVPLADGNRIQINAPKHYTDLMSRTDAMKLTLDKLEQAVELFQDNRDAVEKIQRHTRT